MQFRTSPDVPVDSWGLGPIATRQRTDSPGRGPERWWCHWGSPVVTVGFTTKSWSIPMTWMIWGYRHDLGGSKFFNHKAGPSPVLNQQPLDYCYILDVPIVVDYIPMISPQYPSHTHTRTHAHTHTLTHTYIYNIRICTHTHIPESQMTHFNFGFSVGHLAAVGLWSFLHRSRPTLSTRPRLSQELHLGCQHGAAVETPSGFLQTISVDSHSHSLSQGGISRVMFFYVLFLYLLSSGYFPLLCLGVLGATLFSGLDLFGH